MSILRFSGKPHFRLFIHPDQTVVARADGRFVMRNLIGDWKTAYRTGTEWHCRLMDAIGRGASFADIRGAIRPLLDEEQTERALEQINDLFTGEVVVVKLVPEDGAALLSLAPHGVEYTPQFAPVADDEKLALSRFAMLRREEGRVLLETSLKPYHLLSETPAGDALLGRFLRAAAVSDVLSQWPASWREPLRDLLALLKHDGILLPAPAGKDCPGRDDEGAAAAQWEAHDLWMHSTSRLGCTQAGYGEFGGVFPNIGRSEPEPAVRPSWDGETIELARPDMEKLYSKDRPFAAVQDERRTVRGYDEQHPISAEQLGHFLYRSCRILFRKEVLVASSRSDTPGRAVLDLAWRPYPCGGASYELETYLSVDRCAGIDSGFYHYDAARHCLVKLGGRTAEMDKALRIACLATGLQARPQVVLHMAARFRRVTWKYRAVAYSGMLRNAGVLYQTFYLVATAMGIAPCGLGAGDIELFRKMTGLDPMIEGSIGDFALGSLPAGYRAQSRETWFN
ncbi:MAG: SagB family peptide dehydrogenase [Gammaproteobacteria bacterium]|nr:SagB family peptide dehydrogenase [Gammaproteobacteria bacterium]